jgi:hypothetical protein
MRELAHAETWCVCVARAPWAPPPAVTYNDGFLGQENADYQAWILNAQHWCVPQVCLTPLPPPPPGAARQ